MFRVKDNASALTAASPAIVRRGPNLLVLPTILMLWTPHSSEFLYNDGLFVARIAKARVGNVSTRLTLLLMSLVVKTVGCSNFGQGS